MPHPRGVRREIAAATSGEDDKAAPPRDAYFSSWRPAARELMKNRHAAGAPTAFIAATIMADRKLAMNGAGGACRERGLLACAKSPKHHAIPDRQRLVCPIDKRSLGR